MLSKVVHSDKVKEPKIETNGHGGQTIILPKPINIKLGKVYLIGSNEKPKVTNSGTETDIVIDFYLPKQQSKSNKPKTDGEQLCFSELQ